MKGQPLKLPRTGVISPGHGDFPIRSIHLSSQDIQHLADTARPGRLKAWETCATLNHGQPFLLNIRAAPSHS